MVGAPAFGSGGPQLEILPQFRYRVMILNGTVNLAHEACKGESLKSPSEQAASVMR